jgi:hypothetical protein
MWQSVRQVSRIALILSPALGDSLLMMTIARNLQLGEIAVTVFGYQAHMIKDWFPGLDILPNLTSSRLAEALQSFDAVIQMHRDRPFSDLHRLHPRVILLESIYRARSSESMVERLMRFCREELGLASAERSNGITAPAGLQHRKRQVAEAFEQMRAQFA